MQKFYIKYQEVIWKATKNLIRDYNELENLQSGSPSIANFVDRSQMRTKEIILKGLDALKVPNLVTEAEKISGYKSDFTLISEINGAENFARAFPFFGFGILQITYDSLKKKKVSCSISFPALMQNFHAETGSGAWVEKLGDRGDGSHGRLRCRKISNAKSAITNQDFLLYNNKIEKTRKFGSSFYDIVALASGRFDAVLVENDDVFAKLALEVFAKEAGGFVKILENGDIIAGNPEIISL